MLTTFLSILSLNNPDLNLCFLLNRRPVYNPQYSADYPDFSPKKRKLQSPPDQNSKVLIINDHATVKKKTERELRATLWPRIDSSFDFTHIFVSAFWWHISNFKHSLTRIAWLNSLTRNAYMPSVLQSVQVGNHFGYSGLKNEATKKSLETQVTFVCIKTTVI